mmetsp:Transcript_115526/g.361364  ORF Transcript_115526/g.361364 Transcript_115526/m.361364 type:complete len:210 (-) Transcript_115526:512-1141(-)
MMTTKSMARAAPFTLATPFTSSSTVRAPSPSSSMSKSVLASETWRPMAASHILIDWLLMMSLSSSSCRLPLKSTSASSKMRCRKLMPRSHSRLGSLSLSRAETTMLTLTSPPRPAAVARTSSESSTRSSMLRPRVCSRLVSPGSVHRALKASGLRSPEPPLLFSAKALRKCSTTRSRPRSCIFIFTKASQSSSSEMSPEESASNCWKRT